MTPGIVTKPTAINELISGISAAANALRRASSGAVPLSISAVSLSAPMLIEFIELAKIMPANGITYRGAYQGVTSSTHTVPRKRMGMPATEIDATAIRYQRRRWLGTGRRAIQLEMTIMPTSTSDTTTPCFDSKRKTRTYPIKSSCNNIRPTPYKAGLAGIAQRIWIRMTTRTGTNINARRVSGIGSIERLMTDFLEITCSPALTLAILILRCFPQQSNLEITDDVFKFFAYCTSNIIFKGAVFRIGQGQPNFRCKHTRDVV